MTACNSLAFLVDSSFLDLSGKLPYDSFDLQTMADQEAFAQALIAPAKPNPALKRAFAKANKLLAD